MGKRAIFEGKGKLDFQGIIILRGKFSFERDNSPNFLCRERFSEVAKMSVSAHRGPILEGTLGSRMGPGGAGMAPPLWTWMGPKCKKAWRTWTGPLQIRDGTWTGPGSDPAEGLDGTPPPKGPCHTKSKIFRCVANLLSHSDLLSQCTLCGHHFPGKYRHFSSQGRAHNVVNMGGGGSKNTTA